MPQERDDISTRGKAVLAPPRHPGPAPPSQPRPHDPAPPPPSISGPWPKSREQPESPAWAVSVPFSLQKEQKSNLGRGSRRWCRAPLGETDRQDDERPPAGLWAPGAGSLPVRPPGERVVQSGPTRRPVQTLLTGGRQGASAAGSRREPGALFAGFCSTPSSLPAPPQECTKSLSLVRGTAGCGGDKAT